MSTFFLTRFSVHHSRIVAKSRAVCVTYTRYHNSASNPACATQIGTRSDIPMSDTAPVSNGNEKTPDTASHSKERFLKTLNVSKVASARMLQSVQEYYGRVLNTSKDLKTGACTAGGAPPARIRKARPVPPFSTPESQSRRRLTTHRNAPAWLTHRACCQIRGIAKLSLRCNQCI